jgi:lipopolysaccharide export system permease protein
MYDESVMKKTLYLYLCREIAVPFLLGTATFTGVLIMGRLLKIADLVVVKGVPLIDIFRTIVYLLPGFCLVTIPMAFLLALLLAFGRLSADSEITAMKACGVGLSSLLPPVLGCALIAYLATTFVTVYALPWGNTSFKKLIYGEIETRATSSIRERVFNDELPGIVLYAERSDPEKHTLSGILIYDERDPAVPSTIFAEQGVIATDTATRVVRMQLRNGSIHRNMPNRGYRMLEFRDYDLSINLSQTEKMIFTNELDMTFKELRMGMRAPWINASARRDLQLEFHRRFSLPFACFVFALIGVPLGIQNERSGKGAGFTMSLTVILAYYIVLSAGRILGERGIIHPAAAVWLPNLLFFVAGVYLFRKTSREERLVFFDLVSAAIVRGRKILGRSRSTP